MHIPNSKKFKFTLDMDDIKIKQLQLTVLQCIRIIHIIAKVPVGGYCKENEQCQERENSGVCKHGRCVCRDGYILYNLKCLEGKFAFSPKK